MYLKDMARHRDTTNEDELDSGMDRGWALYLIQKKNKEGSSQKRLLHESRFVM